MTAGAASVGPPGGLLPGVEVAAPRGARADVAAAQSAAAAAAAKAAAARDAEDAALMAPSADDSRAVPHHEVLFRQAVGAGDAFLGLSGKDPSSLCCEQLLVRVRLPEAESAAGLDLDVTPARLRLTSSR